MRYEGTRPSREDSQKDVHVLALGIEELKVMLDVFNDIYKRTPRIFETNQFLNRIRNMRKCIMKALIDREKKDV